MSAEDIEATKAPLMDHLIELRSRLIKALLAFGLAFILCFIFAKQIYNVLVWPFVWVAGPENSKFIYTALLEYFLTQLKLAMFGAGFLSWLVWTPACMAGWALTGAIADPQRYGLDLMMVVVFSAMSVNVFKRAKAHLHAR